MIMSLLIVGIQEKASASDSLVKQLQKNSINFDALFIVSNGHCSSFPDDLLLSLVSRENILFLQVDFAITIPVDNGRGDIFGYVLHTSILQPTYLPSSPPYFRTVT